MNFDLPDRARKTLMFLAGMIGVGYETVIEHADRPYLLALFGGMLGLPYFFGRDSKGSKDGNTPPVADPPPPPVPPPTGPPGDPGPAPADSTVIGG